MNFDKKTHNLVRSSMIAAVYTLLTFVFAPISFGAVQFRVSEALTILPLFTPIAVPGLIVGCFASNIIGVFMGVCSVWDPLFGTVATALAAVATYYIGKTPLPSLHYILGPLPAVLFNGFIVGGEITLFFSDSSLFFINAAVIALGEFIVCYLIGIPLIFLFRKNAFLKKLL